MTCQQGYFLSISTPVTFSKIEIKVEKLISVRHVNGIVESKADGYQKPIIVSWAGASLSCQTLSLSFKNIFHSLKKTSD